MALSVRIPLRLCLFLNYAHLHFVGMCQCEDRVQLERRDSKDIFYSTLSLSHATLSHERTFVILRAAVRLECASCSYAKAAQYPGTYRGKRTAFHLRFISSKRPSNRISSDPSYKITVCTTLTSTLSSYLEPHRRCSCIEASCSTRPPALRHGPEKEHTP